MKIKHRKYLKKHIKYIKNTFKTKYHIGYIEVNNDYKKALKRTAFGYRSFTRFKTGIMICKGLVKLKEKEVENL